MLTFQGTLCIINLAVEENSKANFELPGCGSAWLERLIWDQEVAGSNPVTPTCWYSFLYTIIYAGVVQW